jgi:hypothetical protein
MRAKRNGGLRRTRATSKGKSPKLRESFRRPDAIQRSLRLPAGILQAHFSGMQVMNRFPDEHTERLALGKLIRRFSGKSWALGETIVPSSALAFLASEGISFTVIGPAPYERITPIRGAGAIAV